MPSKFTKTILTPGRYLVNDGKGGRAWTMITEDRLKHWASQHAAMIEAGLHVPAPLVHKKDAQPVLNRGEIDPNARNNIGFWEKLVVTPKGRLKGLIDVPVESDQQDVIGKKVKSTSIWAEPEYVDGKGRVWKDVLTHIAVTNHPIEPGQENFQPGVIGMAQMLKEDGQVGDNELDDEFGDPDDLTIDADKDVFNLLSSVAGVWVDPTTPAEQLPVALKNALLQKQLDSNQSGGMGTLSQPPKGATVKKEVPITMSQQQQQTPPGSATTTTVAPAPTVDPQLQIVMAQNQQIMTVFTNQTRASLASRLGQLKQRGIISEQTFTNYSSQVSSVTPKFGADGQPLPSEVEIAIKALESVTIPVTNQPVVAMGQQLADGTFVVQPQVLQANGDGSVTPERAQDIVNTLFGTATA